LSGRFTVIGALLLRYSLVGFLRSRAIRHLDRRLTRDGVTQAEFGPVATDRVLWADITGNLWGAMAVGGICGAPLALLGRAVGGAGKAALFFLSGVMIFWSAGASAVFNVQYMWFKRKTQYQYHSAIINAMGSSRAAAVAATLPALLAVAAAMFFAVTLGRE